MIGPAIKHLNRLFACGLIYGLSACTPPEILSVPGDSANILSLPAGFNINELPSGWVLYGNAGTVQVSPSNVDPLHELSVTSSDKGFALMRMTDAVLLATPYLHWRWNLAPGDWAYHPVRLLIGFSGGKPVQPESKGFAGLFSTQKPAFKDRGLSIVWGPSALMRGTLSYFGNSQNTLNEARYTIRGGQENTGIWKSETLDLSHLYARAWPNDDISKVKITSIGLGVAKSQPPYSALIGDIRLSR